MYFNGAMTNGPGLQRELKLEPGNPIADAYLPAIHAAVVSAVDGVVEVQLRELAPGWFLRAVADAGLYERRKEPRPDPRGAIRGHWVWRERPSVEQLPGPRC
jgi:hypothetical protein